MNISFIRHKPGVKCNREFCPICTRINFRYKVINALKSEDFASFSPPTVFVGSRLQYPNVNVGILSPPEKVEDAWIYDAPNFWSERNFSIKDIVELRSGMINSRFRTNVYNIRNNRFLDIAQEVGMAMEQVDLEIELKKKPKVNLEFNDVLMPMGPSANLKKAKIVGNTKISSKVDKVVSDTDLKATDAIKYLYSKDFNEHSLSQLLSIGVLGVKKNRKLVPLRWSITGIDDSLSKELLSKIKDFSLVNDYEVYFDGYFGNYYFILFFPENFSYELFETFVPQYGNIKVGTDYESYYGRKSYASSTAGGYYSVRFAITEHLNDRKRQASVLVFRFITNEYIAPLGVWVTREATRKSLRNKIATFKSKEDILDFARKFVKERFNFNLDLLIEQSKLLESLEQTKLRSWI